MHYDLLHGSQRPNCYLIQGTTSLTSYVSTKYRTLSGFALQQTHRCSRRNFKLRHLHFILKTVRVVAKQHLSTPTSCCAIWALLYSIAHEHGPDQRYGLRRQVCLAWDCLCGIVYICLSVSACLSVSRYVHRHARVRTSMTHFWLTYLRLGIWGPTIKRKKNKAQGGRWEVCQSYGMRWRSSERHVDVKRYYMPVFHKKYSPQKFNITNRVRVADTNFTFDGCSSEVYFELRPVNRCFCNSTLTEVAWNTLNWCKPAMLNVSRKIRILCVDNSLYLGKASLIVTA